MARVAVAFALAIALFAGRAGAEEPHDAGTRVTAERQPKHWYGWQILALDGAAFTTVMIGHDDPAIGLPSFAVWGLGAPVTHLAHGNAGGALGSFGLRALGSAVSFFTALDNCREDEAQRRVKCSPPTGLLLLAVASGLDAGLLAYSTPAPPEPPPSVDAPSLHRERTPRRRERPPSRFSFLRVTPTVGAAPHGVFVGATGVF